jgi:hypothetical protein
MKQTARHPHVHLTPIQFLVLSADCRLPFAAVGQIWVVAAEDSY